MTLPPFLTNGPAACAQPDVDPSLWDSTATADQNRAVQVCQGCPLRPACLDHALSARERWGTWGGLTADQRHRLLSGSDGSWLDVEGRVRRPCGTESALASHRSYEEVCDACQAAHDARVLASRRELLERAHNAGGTVAGAAVHRRIGEPVCEACAGAVARQSAEQRTARQAPVQPRRQVLAA